MPDEHPLIVIGLHQSTEAYPNTLYRTRELREHLGAFEVNFQLWSKPTGGWTGFRSPLRMLWRAVRLHIHIALEILCRARYEVAYVPYPAPTVALLLSLLPNRPRRIVLDAFISLYDTVVNDRKLWRPGAAQSRLLRSIERRAFARADVVVVDTPQNADFYAEQFRLPRAKFVSLPLATNETDYAYDPYQPVVGRCRVLFIGTLVPLHGIDTIAGAAKLLSTRRDIEFRILGDGIDAPKLKACVEGMPNLTWYRRWHSVEELAREIRNADICLGIFGNTDKTQRVCPYKLYAYASVGRATITGDTEWLRSVSAAGGPMPFHAVPVGNPRALADAILELADSSNERACLAQAARNFYASQLANAVSMRALTKVLGWSIEGGWT